MCSTPPIIIYILRHSSGLISGRKQKSSAWMAAGSGRERIQAILGENRYSELPISWNKMLIFEKLRWILRLMAEKERNGKIR